MALVLILMRFKNIFREEKSYVAGSHGNKTLLH